jgi:hypothetical protein
MTQPLQSKPSSVLVHVVDIGKIVMGAGLCLPIAPTHVADPGKISFGAGLRLPAGRKSA